MPTRIHTYRHVHTEGDERYVLPDGRYLLYSVASYDVHQASHPGGHNGDTTMSESTTYLIGRSRKSNRLDITHQGKGVYIARLAMHGVGGEAVCCLPGLRIWLRTRLTKMGGGVETLKLVSGADLIGTL